MDVAVYGHGAGNLVVALHATNGDSHVVNHAEAFAMVGKGMVEAAADVEGDAIFQRIVRSQDRPTRSRPEGADEFGRVRKLHLHLVLRQERSSLECSAVVRSDVYLDV